MTSSGVVTKAVLLIIAYFISGRIGLLLAVPPGYATAIFPASGVALAGLLLYGYRFWPAVCVGSFLINISFSFDNATVESGYRSVYIAMGIGLGAALQGLLGAFLIKRFVGFPTGLEREGDVLKFFILASPVSCLVNASIGTAILISAGAVSDTNLVVNWFTWWTGDAIGVVIITPLILIWLAEPADIWRQRKTNLALPLVITFALSVLVNVYASKQEAGRIAHIRTSLLPIM